MLSSQRTGRSNVLVLLCCLATSRPARPDLAAFVSPAVAVVAFEPTVPPRPSFVRVDDVSQQYPATWQRKLFSSVPQREHAVRNVTLSFGRAGPSPTAHAADGGMTVLVGRSASGKSTLLRLIAGTERPTAGRVSVNGRALDAHARVGATPPGLASWVTLGAPRPRDVGVRPVLLQGKPCFDDTLSVMERLVRVAHEAAHPCGPASPGEGRDGGGLLRALAGDFAGLLALSPAQCAAPPSALSPSGEYLFGLACGCLLSVAPGARDAPDAARRDGLRYPILLFDELFDAEHPNTVEKCSKGISNLVRWGGVVVAATHKPEYFEGVRSKTVTLSGGRVLKVETDTRPE